MSHETETILWAAGLSLGCPMLFWLLGHVWIALDKYKGMPR